MECRLILQSPLVKIFPEEGPLKPAYRVFSALQGETASFQAVYKGNNLCREELTVCTDSPLNPYIRVRGIELCPSAYPCHIETDNGYLRTAPGLFPDYLSGLPGRRALLIPGQWRSLWIDAELPADCAQGRYPIEVSLIGENGECLCSAAAELNVIGAVLPEQKLIHTEWFHGDCLADYYGVQALSESWWGIAASFVKTAVKRGINMILTPAFTPPLDTAAGGERTTVQLVDVYEKNNTYAFVFDNLRRWIELCGSLGIKYFEMPHLFTQWGAKAAPKIMAYKDGLCRRIFGWDTPAVGGGYTRFLSQYLPVLTNKLREWGIAERTYFHISDEPSYEHLENYLAAKNSVIEYLSGFHIIDALSSFEFYKSGAVSEPIPSSDHIKPFLENNVPRLWTYYCTGQHLKVSNRFFAMPSARNRIIGVQLYKFNIAGFLHWGFNFYNSMHSKRHINPFAVTDSEGAFPSGDPFMVYPNKDGTPGESIRIMVFHEALQDLRALELLESLAGREFVLGLIEEGADMPVTFGEYPKTDEYILDLREKVNREIEKRIIGQPGGIS